MATLALLLLVPLLWPFVAKLIWKHEITFGEMALNLAVGAVIVVAGWYGGRYSQVHDVEILNGSLTGKSSERVSCSHDYKCRCRPVCRGTGKDKSCSEECDTCYDHPYDKDWHLQTTLGTLDVSRVDRQGVNEPPRWSRAVVGDPVAQEHWFSNYIKGAPNSLFNTLKEKSALQEFAGRVPVYPNEVFDLHYVNRVLPVGVALPDLASWNHDLAMMLKTLGPAKQANVVIVIANEQNPNYAAAVNAAWLGGKKNDVVVVIGAPNYPKMGWVRVLSWTDSELFKVQLRDELQALPAVDRAAVLGLVNTHVLRAFVRKPMADFSYLLNEIEPPTWMLVSLFFASLIASIGTSIWASRNAIRGVGPISRIRNVGTRFGSGSRKFF